MKIGAVMKVHRSHQNFSHQKKVRLIKNKNKKIISLQTLFNHWKWTIWTSYSPGALENSYDYIIIQVCKHFIKPKKKLQIIHYTHYINKLDPAKNPLIFMYGW